MEFQFQLSAQWQVFLNPLLVEVIAKACSVEDLKSFRLASKKFHENSLPVWRKRAVFSLDPLRRRSDMDQFIKQLNKSKDYFMKPFSNVRLAFCTLPPTTLTDDREWKARSEFQFYSKYGNNITYLHLLHCTFNQSKLVDVISNYFPKLKTLIIDGIQRSREGGRELDTQLWKPHVNLEKIHISGYLPFPNWKFLQYLPNIKEIKLLKFSDDRMLTAWGNLRKLTQGGNVVEGKAEMMCNRDHEYYHRRAFTCCWRIAFVDKH